MKIGAMNGLSAFPLRPASLLDSLSLQLSDWWRDPEAAPAPEDEGEMKDVLYGRLTSSVRS